MQYQITLDESDLSVLNAALVELPYRVAAPLISKINAQLAEQASKDKPEGLS